MLQIISERGARTALHAILPIADDPFAGEIGGLCEDLFDTGRREFLNYGHTLGHAIERVTDLALRAVPTVEPGILFVERQFGVLEVHGPDLADVERAGQAILTGLGADAADQLRPRILFSDVIKDVTDRQAVIINRNRGGSMMIPGDPLLVCEVSPALFSAVAANEAERAAPGVTLVDVSMIGLAGRIYLSGAAPDVLRAQQEIASVLGAVAGRASLGPLEPSRAERADLRHHRPRPQRPGFPASITVHRLGVCPQSPFPDSPASATATLIPSRAESQRASRSSILVCSVPVTGRRLVQ